MTHNDDQAPDSNAQPKLTLRLPGKKSKSKTGGMKSGGMNSGGPRPNRFHSKDKSKNPHQSRPDQQKTGRHKSGRTYGKPNDKKPEPIAADARRLCLLLLRRLFEDGMHFDQAFNNLPGLDRLEARDRGFIRHLASMVLRYHGQLGEVIDVMVPKAPSDKARLILMMGIAQICILQTGAHAATNTTVELMRQAGEDSLAGLANAVMRRLIREELQIWKETNPLSNLPDHLYESWVDAYGEARCQSIMRYVQQVPPLDISAKVPSDFSEALSGRLLDQTIRTQFEGDVTAMNGYAKGAWWVQDVAAALPAQLVPKDAETIIDLCAAPGGKTAQLCARGASVTAIEKDEKRADRLERNLQRLHFNPTMIISDGLDFMPSEPVDAVLLDAPCSATGTVRRRPDILLREHNDKSRDTVKMLTELQLALAAQAANWLKPGGSLIYATCSLQPEEGEHIITQLLEWRPDLTLDPIEPDEAGALKSAISPEGWMRILPDCITDGGNDGFFVARLKRYHE